MHVLVVEDDAVLADGLSRVLGGHGMVVEVVGDGDRADALLQRAAQAEVIVLDIGLPGIDGFEVVRRLRARGSQVPVLLLTARDAIEDRVRGLELGAVSNRTGTWLPRARSRRTTSKPSTPGRPMSSTITSATLPVAARCSSASAWAPSPTTSTTMPWPPNTRLRPSASTASSSTTSTCMLCALRLGFVHYAPAINRNIVTV